MSTPSGHDLVPRIFWGKFLARGAEIGSTDSNALILMCGWCGSRRGTDTRQTRFPAMQPVSQLTNSRTAISLRKSAKGRSSP